MPSDDQVVTATGCASTALQATGVASTSGYSEQSSMIMKNETAILPKSPELPFTLESDSSSTLW